MKKFLIFACAALIAACSNTVTEQPGTEDLKQLDAEPIGCAFLYKIESESSVYSREDAERHLKNRIAADRAHKESAFWIISTRLTENPGAVFGPKQTYHLTANVYECE